jgi:putative transposase
MIKLIPNEKVFYQGRESCIHKEKDLENIYIKDNATKAVHLVKICDLSDKAPDEPTVQDPYDRPIESYPEKKLARARWRLAMIEPFLGELRGNKEMLTKVAIC